MIYNIPDIVWNIVYKKILSMRSRINLLLFYSINYKLNREYSKVPGGKIFMVYEIRLYGFIISQVILYKLSMIKLWYNEYRS